MYCVITTFSLIFIFVEPVHDGSNKWQATSSDLFSDVIKKHTSSNSPCISHTAFFTGQDYVGPRGIAFFGTSCLKSSNGL